MSSEKLVHQSWKAINGILANSAWQKKMAPLGFTVQALQDAKATGLELQQLAARQQKEYGEQYNATDAMYQAKKAAWQVYKNHLRIARIALENDRGQYKALQLGGIRERNILKWVKQARTFYTNIKNVEASLNKYGIKAEDLAQGEAMVEAVYQAYERRDKERDEARQSTQAHRQSQAQLSRWMKRYERALQFVFADQPEVLKELGLQLKREIV